MENNSVMEIEKGFIALAYLIMKLITKMEHLCSKTVQDEIVR